jgi:TolA-binding protein
MDQLRASSGGGRQQDSDSSVNAVTEMREQMARMNLEIEGLRENRRSEWAMGLTNEPPPGYTPMSIGSPTMTVRRAQ